MNAGELFSTWSLTKEMERKDILGMIYLHDSEGLVDGYRQERSMGHYYWLTVLVPALVDSHQGNSDQKSPSCEGAPERLSAYLPELKVSNVIFKKIYYFHSLVDLATKLNRRS